MSTAAARHAVADALRVVPGLQVHAQPVTIDRVPTSGVAMVATVGRAYRAPYATPCGVPVEVSVLIACGVPDTDAAALFDSLDNLLDAVTAALDLAGMTPTDAVLDSLLDTYPAFLITVEVTG